MACRPLLMSPNYLAYLRGIRALHRLTMSGMDESPEAEAVRDAMDAPWEALSETERKRAHGLSADLYSLSDPNHSQRYQMGAQARDKLNNVVKARQRGEWDRALELLRPLADFVDPALMSFLRGSIWLRAGDSETALLFVAHALELSHDEGNLLGIVRSYLE